MVYKRLFESSHKIGNNRDRRKSPRDVSPCQDEKNPPICGRGGACVLQKLSRNFLSTPRHLFSGCRLGSQDLDTLSSLYGPTPVFPNGGCSIGTSAKVGNHHVSPLQYPQVLNKKDGFSETYNSRDGRNPNRYHIHSQGLTCIFFCWIINEVRRQEDLRCGIHR